MKTLKSVIGLTIAAAAFGQQHTPRGTATDVANAEVEATLAKTAGAAVSDQAIRVVSINSEYNVGVGVVHRSKTALGLKGNANAVEHSQITEVYHFIRGNVIFENSGTIE